VEDSVGFGLLSFDLRFTFGRPLCPAARWRLPHRSGERGLRGAGFGHTLVVVTFFVKELAPAILVGVAPGETVSSNNIRAIRAAKVARVLIVPPASLVALVLFLIA